MTTACRCEPGESRRKMVRFRTLGCYPLTGAIESARRYAGNHPGDAADHHVGAPGRVIDHDQSASMEKKKQEGYF
jgi:sulfate adenylyltransferase subunit 2